MVASTRLRRRNEFYFKNNRANCCCSDKSNYIQWIAITISAIVAIAASWIGVRLSIDYDSGKEKNKTSVQFIEVLIDLQFCVSRYVRNPKEWKSKLDVQNRATADIPADKEICDTRSLKKILLSSDSIPSASHSHIVHKLCNELKVDIEQISTNQLKSVLPNRDALRDSSVIERLYSTSRTMLGNAQYGLDSFVGYVSLAGYKCSDNKLVASKEFVELENRYLGLAKINGTSLNSSSQMIRSSAFGFRKDPFTGRSIIHTGMDFGAPLGTPVYAVISGVVNTGQHSAYGNFVVISSNERVDVRYHHLASIAIKDGSYVNVGDPVGTVGNTGRSTGPHLHLEKRINDIPVDPSEYKIKDIFKVNGLVD